MTKHERGWIISQPRVVEVSTLSVMTVCIPTSTNSLLLSVRYGSFFALPVWSPTVRGLVVLLDESQSMCIDLDSRTQQNESLKEPIHKHTALTQGSSTWQLKLLPAA